jgi:hypothetical protein
MLEQIDEHLGRQGRGERLEGWLEQDGNRQDRPRTAQQADRTDHTAAARTIPPEQDRRQSRR